MQKYTKTGSILAAFIVVFGLFSAFSAPALAGEGCPPSKLVSPPYSQDLLGYIKFSEGLCPTPYLDSLGFWTVGVGHQCPGGAVGECTPGITLSDADIDALLAKDLETAKSRARKITPKYDQLDAARQAILLDMSFQMGMKVATQFKKMVAGINAGDFETAALEACDSGWAKQTPDRASRASYVLKTGQFPAKVDNKRFPVTADGKSYKCSDVVAGKPPSVAAVGATGGGATTSGATTGSLGSGNNTVGGRSTGGSYSAAGANPIASTGQITIDLMVSFTRPPDVVTAACATRKGETNPIDKKPILLKNDGEPSESEGQWRCRFDGTVKQVLRGTDGVDILKQTIKYFYRLFAGLIGIVAVFMIVLGGIQIATAGANPDGLDAGKKKIIAALSGVALLFLSSLILYAVNPNFFTI